MNKKPNSPSIWYKKPEATDEVVVKVQRMFPNCQKYKKDKIIKEILERLGKEDITIQRVGTWNGRSALWVEWKD